MRALRAGSLCAALILTATLAASPPSALGAPGGGAVPESLQGYAESSVPASSERIQGRRANVGGGGGKEEPAGPQELEARKYIGEAWLDPEEPAVANPRDLRSADVYTDKAAGFVAAIGKFQAAPTTADTSLAIYTGVLSGGTCTARQIVVAPTRGGKGGWITFDAAGNVTDSGTKGVVSTRVDKRTVVEANVGAFKTGTFDCGFARVASDNGSTTYDLTGYVPFGEVAQKLEFYFGSRFTGAESTPLHVGRVVGKKGKVRITVRNDIVGLDLSDITDATMGMAHPGHAKVKPSVAGLGTIESYDEKAATFAVTLTKRKTAVLTWTAVGDYSVTNGTVTIHPSPAPLTWGTSLSGRRFWAETSLDWERKGLWFVNKRFAYVGFPNGGRPTCTKASTKCKPYSYSKAKRKLVIGGKAAKVKGLGFTWNKHSYRPLAVPKAGTRWQTALIHTNATSSGTLEYLDLFFSDDGTFASRRQAHAGVAAESSAASTRASAASTPVGDGTYKVLKNGHLRLTYDGGEVVDTNVGIMVNKQGRPDPWETGLFVGDLEYVYD